MKLELKKLPRDGIPAALAKAERYRLLNEPGQAESICLDILDVDPAHHEALILLLLARTDQYTRDPGARVADTRDVLDRLTGDYDRAYYAGLICERWAKAQLGRNQPGSAHNVVSYLNEAMGYYERAQGFDPAASDPVLRWNACVRLIERHAHLEPTPDKGFSPLLE